MVAFPGKNNSLAIGHSLLNEYLLSLLLLHSFLAFALLTAAIRMYEVTHIVQDEDSLTDPSHATSPPRLHNHHKQHDPVRIVTVQPGYTIRDGITFS